MLDPRSLEDIIKANPKVDPQELEEARELLRRLRDTRAGRSSCRLVAPTARRRAVAGEHVESDPRTVHLRHRR